MPRTVHILAVCASVFLAVSTSFAVPKPPKPAPPKPPKPPSSAINQLHQRNAAAQQQLQRTAAAKHQQNNAANNAAKQQLALQRAQAAQASRDYQARSKEQQLFLKERERTRFDDRPQGRAGEVWRDNSAGPTIESGQREEPVTVIQPAKDSR